MISQLYVIHHGMSSRIYFTHKWCLSLYIHREGAHFVLGGKMLNTYSLREAIAPPTLSCWLLYHHPPSKSCDFSGTVPPLGLRLVFKLEFGLCGPVEKQVWIAKIAKAGGPISWKQGKLCCCFFRPSHTLWSNIYHLHTWLLRIFFYNLMHKWRDFDNC